MAKLTQDQIINQLTARVNALYSEARSNRAMLQSAKASGIGGLITGGIGLIAFPALGIPAAVAGAGLWAFAIAAEAITTNNITPFPWMRTRLLDMASSFDRMAASNGVSAEEIELTDYLPVEQRIEYLLICAQGKALALALSQLEAVEIESKFALIVQQAINVYGAHGLKLQQAMQEGGDFLFDVASEFALELPEPISRVTPGTAANLIGESTQLGAIEVQPTRALPIASDPVASEPVVSDAARKITDIPMPERAAMLIRRMEDSGFKIGDILSKSVTVIAGEQRGGKGTLLTMLGILMKAFNPNMQVLYFAAGNDIYPAAFDLVVCADSFPGSKNPDRLVFDELHKTVMALKQAPRYSAENIFIVVDEAIALGSAANADKNAEMAQYLLTQFAKTGAAAAIVLHAGNLTAWMGQGNTKGLAQTFKASANFIGCGTQSMANPRQPMRRIQIASGEYFLADPDNFGQRAKGDSDLGEVPDFLLTAKNPENGSPDPVRSLLNFFPELINESPVTMLRSPKAEPNSEPRSEPKTEPNFWDDLQTDHWASKSSDQSGAQAAQQNGEWTSTTVSAAPVTESLIDRQFSMIQASIEAGRSGDALSVFELAMHFNLAEHEAVQLATLYAFRNKRSCRYDAQQQALIKI